MHRAPPWLPRRPPLAAGGHWWGPVRSRAGSWLANQLLRRGIAYTSLRQDLALTGRTFEQALGRKVTLAGAGLVIGLLGSAVHRVGR